jgi:energy-coupling factor transport system permease protein
MANNLAIPESTTKKNSEALELDGLIKFILALALTIMPFYFAMPVSFGILGIYLLVITVVLKVRARTLLISAASYGIIVLIPYFFGLLMNYLFFSFTHNEIFAFQGSYDVFLRLFRLFVIWYVSILYFHSTPMEIVIGLLDKLFTPLKLIGVPVADYLKVMMCIVIELKESGTEAKKSLGESMRSAMAGSKKFRLNIKGIAQIIVSLIVNSFEKIDKIQCFVEEVKPEDLYGYRFKLSFKDILAVLSIVILTAAVWAVERGIWG